MTFRDLEFETPYCEGRIQFCPENSPKQTKVHLKFDSLDAKRDQEIHLAELFDVLEALGFYGSEYHTREGVIWRLGNLWRSATDDRAINVVVCRITKPFDEEYHR
jgi:hypothetical protein